jgi:branched-chain amino acid transport system substrate-binding protein
MQTRREAKEIKIGAILPLTGDLAVYGDPVKKGMELALEEINAKGGINGKPLKLIFEDDFGDPKTAVAVFNKLIDNEKVPIILGPLTSSASMATAPIAEKRKVVQLSTMAGTIDLKYAGDYVFRVFASNEYQSKSVADKAIDIFNAKRAAILYINNDYGEGSKEVIEKRYSERGGKIVAVENFNEGDKDFKTQLIKIKKSNPDIIFALCYWKEGAIILKQAKELGIKITFLGEDAWYGPIEEIAGDAVKLLVFSSMAFGEKYKEHPKMQKFIQSFRKKYGKEPDAYSATGYDAVYLAKHAIEIGGYNADGIKKALYNTKNFIGALGNITYDEYGDNIGAEFDLYVIRNGKTLRYLDVIKEEKIESLNYKKKSK